MCVCIEKKMSKRSSAAHNMDLGNYFKTFTGRMEE